jgi:type I restriction enzyme S subunit
MGTFFENFESFADTPNGIKRLRNLIIQLAVQGKLERQNRNDEPASILLEKVKIDKEKLIKEKNIRKINQISSLLCDDIPFELPNKWIWAKIGEISLVKGGKRIPKGGSFSSNPTPHIYIQVTNMKKGTIIEEKLKFIDEDVYQSIKKYFIEKDDLYITIAGTIGEVGEVPEKFHKMNLTENAAKIVFRGLNKKYFLIALKSNTVQEQFLEKTNQQAQPKLALKRIADAIIPIPPLEEQKRIVTKVDQLMILCDELEARQQKKHEQRIHLNNAALDKLLTEPTPEEFAQNWQRICDNFDLLYDVPETVGQLRQAILQLAVQGKLVAQDEGDEPAAVLVEEIKDEKERLIKEKKIKNLKSSPSIRPEEIPHHNPKNWELIRLRDLGEICGGGTPSKNKIEYWDGEINWFSPKDMKNKHVNKSKLRISDKALEETHLRMIPVNSILMVARSGILKRYFPVCINDVKCTVNQDIKVLIPFIPGITQYLQLILKGHQQFILENLVKGGMTVQSLKYAEFEQQPFPLPPKKEQKRIVAKVDQLMALCDELEAGLVQAQTEGGELMEAVVHHVLAE